MHTNPPHKTQPYCHLKYIIYSKIKSLLGQKMLWIIVGLFQDITNNKEEKKWICCGCLIISVSNSRQTPMSKSYSFSFQPKPNKRRGGKFCKSTSNPGTILSGAICSYFLTTEVLKIKTFLENHLLFKMPNVLKEGRHLLYRQVCCQVHHPPATLCLMETYLWGAWSEICLTTVPVEDMMNCTITAFPSQTPCVPLEGLLH